MNKMDKINKVILIYECIPDYLKVYNLIVNDEEYCKLLNCHNKYFNSDEDENLDWLNEWIMDKEDFVVFDNTVDDQKPMIDIVGEPFTIVVTGFIL